MLDVRGFLFELSKAINSTQRDPQLLILSLQMNAVRHPAGLPSNQVALQQAGKLRKEGQSQSL